MLTIPKFSAADIVNPEDWDAYHGQRPWLLHDNGFTVCVVFAPTLQDALDEAVDADKLDAWQVSPDDYADYGGEGAAWDSCASLGNAGELFDIEAMGVVELPPIDRAALAQALSDYLQRG